MQCSEANLKSVHSDCNAQIVVNCPKINGNARKSICFSRQIITHKGKFFFKLLKVYPNNIKISN